MPPPPEVEAPRLPADRVVGVADQKHFVDKRPEDSPSVLDLTDCDPPCGAQSTRQTCWAVMPFATRPGCDRIGGRRRVLSGGLCLRLWFCTPNYHLWGAIPRLSLSSFKCTLQKYQVGSVMILDRSDIFDSQHRFYCRRWKEGDVHEHSQLGHDV